MAFLLTVHIVDPGDDTIKVSHNFWGFSVRECETYKREHLASCEYFRAAEKEGRTIEELDEIEASEMPDADEFEEEEEDAG